MIHVLAILTAKPGKRAELLEAFHAVMPMVHAEDGCIEYAPAIDTDHAIASADFGPDSYVVIEKWATKEALSAHVKTPHMAAYAAKSKDLIANRILHVLESA
ncbi:MULTISPECIES: putative quinol monooxygenase [Acidiphilium]|jgi:quinol monooxygenase YgiN|uniref:Quinol monooxygenase YgiN n=1 Tax=Acidiphilium rubrum TaxID=526 RepID=A0A8G2CM95_ACIRU|nr:MULTISPECIES: putative quinol monooxygenase [Acidiphilium]OYW02563.1 MAG: antibiotic biosynthesis monooxygenase [Acidiphilium sp. 37-64-53]OZB29852.1 MAG: antibiotic biosynthesis monooxygenase [Acidiphilium sp. 34-64-41]SIR18951.1 Quinol monooxygenase YgiN [Acidiphilium rubrum]HQT84058.1 putative quinol monooxygenase [Acidiphilium rubrum]